MNQVVYKKCPGQDLSRKKIEDVVTNIPCPRCGYAVELFFDDVFRSCPECGQRVDKNPEKLQKDFGCAVWCEAAEECLSLDTVGKIKKNKKKD